MEQLTNILYWLTTGLLVPVIVFLLFFFLQSLWLISSLYGAYINRSKVNTKLNKLINEEGVNAVMNAVPDRVDKEGNLMESLSRIKKSTHTPQILDKILGDFEIKSEKSIGKSKLLVKIGPMLGLMGTLIPMGPALVGLANGDVASMANNMQVAFSTTVLGIVVGAIGFITLQVKLRWAADDMNILDFVTESLKKEDENETK